jgi:hypothetical protein
LLLASAHAQPGAVLLVSVTDGQIKWLSFSLSINLRTREETQMTTFHCLPKTSAKRRLYESKVPGWPCAALRYMAFRERLRNEQRSYLALPSTSLLYC